MECFVVPNNTHVMAIMRTHNYVLEIWNVSKTKIRKVMLWLDLGINKDTSCNTKECDHFTIYNVRI